MNVRTRTIVFFLLASALAGTSCGPAIAARIDGTTIVTSELSNELNAMRGNPRYAGFLERVGNGKVFDDSRLIGSLVAQVLTVELTAIVIHREFERLSLKPTSDDRVKGRNEAKAAAWEPSIFRAFPVWYQNELLRRSLERVTLRHTLVADETPEKYYAERKDEFVQPCSRDIVVATRSEAEAARTRVLNGESFADVARDVSIDTGTSPRGGDLGCNNRSDLKPALNKAALTQPLGEVGRPIRTDEGYHLLLIEKRDIRPLRIIRNLVVGSIEKLSRKRLDALVNKHFRHAHVEVTPDFGRWTGQEVVPR